VRVSHIWSAATPVFDDDHLVSYAGLVPVMALTEQTGLSTLITDKVRIDPAKTKVASAGVNPAPKLTSIIAGMAAGADSIDDLDVIRSGGMHRLFGGVYACATLGQFLREFTHGHCAQLSAVPRGHLIGLVERTDCLPGIEERCFIDIDSLLRPVYGHHKQGASYGHTKISSRQVLRKGLSPLAAVISTERAAPMIAGIRLRAGKAGSGKGAASMVSEAIRTARAAGAKWEILIRGDSAYGSRAVIRAALTAGVKFSLVLAKNPAVNRLRRHQGRGHRPPDRAPGPRPEHNRRAVPGVALPPVLHQQHRVRHRRRHHPPTARHRRNHLRRPDRRPAGPHASGRFARTTPGRSWPASPTTCCAPPALSPVPRTPWPAVRPCAGRSSASPPGWPARNANRCCTCPSIGPGPNSGTGSGPPSSTPAPRRSSDPTAHRPKRARPEPTVEKLAADQRYRHASTSQTMINTVQEHDPAPIDQHRIFSTDSGLGLATK